MKINSKMYRFSRKVYYTICEVQDVGPPYRNVRVVYLTEGVRPRREMETVNAFCQAFCPGQGFIYLEELVCFLNSHKVAV